MSTTLVVTVIKLCKIIEGISDTFSPWLFLLGTLLEESSPIPVKLRKSASFRLVVGVWGVMAILLTNIYNGLMISELNSPIKGSQIDDINGLANRMDDTVIPEKLVPLDIYADVLMDLFYSRNLSSIVIPKLSSPRTYFSLLSHPQRGQDMSKPNYIFLNYLLWWYIPFRGLGNFKTVPELITKNDLVRLALFNPKHAHWPVSMEIGVRNYSEEEASYLVENELISCRRSAFFQKSSIIEEELTYYRKSYHWIKFHRGKETFDGRWEGWSFEGEGISKIPRYLQSLVETGIHEELSKAGMKLRFKNRVPLIQSKAGEKSTDKIGFNGGIVTLFILWGTMLGVSLLGLLAELCLCTWFSR